VILGLLVGAAVSCSGKDGQLRAAWTLTLNGSPSTCANAGAAKVELVATPAGGGDAAQAFRFGCSAGSGTTNGLAPGAYDVSMAVYDAHDQPMVAVRLPGTRELGEGQVLDLGVIPFDVEVRTLAFAVNFGGAINNCGGGATGAAVTNEQIVIAPAGEARCLAYALQAGTVQAQTCQELACQEPQVKLSVFGLPPGSYDLTVLGYKGSGAGYVCYLTPPVRVTLGVADVDLGVISVPYDVSMDITGCAAPGCHCQ